MWWADPCVEMVFDVLRSVAPSLVGSAFFKVVALFWMSFWRVVVAGLVVVL